MSLVSQSHDFSKKFNPLGKSQEMGKGQIKDMLAEEKGSVTPDFKHMRDMKKKIFSLKL